MPEGVITWWDLPGNVPEPTPPNPFIDLAPGQNPADPCAGCPEYYSAANTCCVALAREDPSPSRRERRMVAADPPAREHLRGHGVPGGLF